MKPTFIAQQGRHPHGPLGWIVARIMARETAAENRHAISLLDVSESDTVLDVGTGHGASIRHLVALAPQGHVTGVDNSKVMLSRARCANRRLINRGNVTITAASSDHLPFSDRSFDRILSVHTVYFWDPIETHLDELRRVLKTEGRLVIGFRPAEDTVMAANFPDSVYRFRTTEQMTGLLTSAGLEVQDVVRKDDPGRSMVWIVAKKT